jgi:hypothetical protein
MIKDKLSIFSLVVIISIGLIFLISGCAKKPLMTLIEEEPAVVEEEVVVVEEEPFLEEVESVIEGIPEEEPSYTGYHIVKKGECLWWIAEYEDIYNDPFMWPLIYNANKDQIKDPDLIYPDQKFKIPRGGYTIEEVKDARYRAGAPRPYSPPAEALLPMD